MFKFLKKKKTPTIDLNVETHVVEAEVKSFKVEMPPYEPPTDKEILEGLEFQDNYEAAFLIRDLKKQNMVLKGKLTKLTKKCNAYKEYLDKANAAVREMIGEKPDDIVDKEKFVAEMNYHNLCARETLYPGVDIKDIPKLTIEDVFGKEYQSEE